MGFELRSLSRSQGIIRTAVVFSLFAVLGFAESALASRQSAPDDATNPGVYVIDGTPEPSYFVASERSWRAYGKSFAELSRPSLPYNPIDLASHWLHQTLQQVVSLIRWNFLPGTISAPPERYDRLKHFGRWIKDRRTPNDCRDTRSRVLERDSQIQVTYTTPSRCAVSHGQWFDPFSGQTLQSARDLEIDHTVPIKNAYDKGAWAWDDDTRCVFFNFMGNRMHLVPIATRENRVKQDAGPDRYMPPRPEYACEYLYNWLAIKLIWDIPMGQSEASSINRLLGQHACPVNLMRLSASDLRDQRQEILNARAMCQQASQQPPMWLQSEPSSQAESLVR